MMTLILITLFILLILFSYYLGSRKAVSISYNERLISLPSYYGYYVAIWCGTPALFVCSIWTIGESWVVDKIIRSELEQIYNFTIENSQLYSTEIRNIASGMLSKEGRSAEILVAAERYSELETIGDAGLITFIFSITLTGLLIGRAKIKTSLKAREFVEKKFELLKSKNNICNF
jgi:phosphate transport system permease protein